MFATMNAINETAPDMRPPVDWMLRLFVEVPDA